MQPIHVLLAEDNAGDVTIFKETFEDAHLNVAIKDVDDGELAIEYLKNQLQLHDGVIPDVVFLDINLPKKNGYQVLDFIKTNQQLSHIPVVMLSTSSWKKDIEMAMSKGAFIFLTKSYDSDDFIGQVMSLGLFDQFTAKG